MSIHEELQIESKTYPENSRTSNVPANGYVTALSQYINSQLLNKLTEHSTTDQFEESITLAQKLAESIIPGKPKPLKLPLKRVIYSPDETVRLPDCENFSLASPSLITNDKTAKTNFFKNLKFELQTADSFDFMVSFIRNSGLQLLINPLSSFTQRGKKGRILTSVYLNITEPDALRKLLEYPDIETRVYAITKESFHTKAYLFGRKSHTNSSALVGSSNISQAALINGEEWNVKIPRSNAPDIYDMATSRFEELWASDKTIPLTEEFIAKYEAYLKSQATSVVKVKATFDYIDESHILDEDPAVVQATQPNAMQQNALDNLIASRNRGENKAVAIAATGTGKTYLAAFDVRQFRASTVLFLAHRDELLEGAVETFSKVFDNRDRCGKLIGTTKDINKPFLFSTVQTLSRDNHLQRFDPDYFDYIIVDEFHHAEAATYQKIINHFTPQFLLGMTATPERMDGRDVLKLCNYNIVCDIRLRQALTLDLLSPFHYFGVADETVDYEQIERQTSGQFVEEKLVNRLNTPERVDYIIEQMKKYGFHGQKRCILGFCVNRTHAQFMHQSFLDKGIHSAALTGLSDPQLRQSTIQQLQDPAHPLEVIFTVDIFNEGVDIPQVNLMLFLRPTESSTIFIQQLGRGLRKAPGKEYVTVLDFIGNYQNSYMVPLALSGEGGRRNFDKAALKRAVSNEFADLPAGCYVELDEVAKERILTKLDSIRLDKINYLKQLYAQFKRDLGCSPEIMDFFTVDDAPNPNFFFSKFGSLYKTKEKCEDSDGNHPELKNNLYLQQISEYLEAMCPIKWPYEFILLLIVIEQKQPVVQIKDIEQRLASYFNQTVDSQKHTSLIRSAMKSLSIPYKEMKWSFGEAKNEFFEVDFQFIKLISNSAFAKTYISDRIHYGLKFFRRHFRPNTFLGEGERFILYQNYTRNDIQFLSEDSAKRGTWREGVQRVEKDYFLFINLNKDTAVDEHLHYKDYFMDPRTFHWQSQNQTSHSGTRGQHYLDHQKLGYRIHLFVRKQAKQYGITLPFMYLGQVDYVSSSGDKPMNIVWKLHHAVPLDLFEDFTE